tara:strand:+ start:1920 stop:6392 length:4473 start_codon:yes stop_codon:yes gene_type:complete
MAAIIQLRRGSTPSSLSYGEIYVNDDSASLALRLSGSGDIVTLAKLEQKNHGNIWIDGDITASSISASGDIKIGGQLFLGDEASDNIVIQGSLSSSLIPETTAANDLGSSTKKWKDLYIGAIYGTTISVTGQTLLSGSGQITAFGFISGSDLDSLNSTASAHDVRLSNLQSTTASLDTRITQLETDTGSQDQRLDRIELETGSLNTTNTTQNARLTSLETNTGSLGGSVTTINNRLGNIETTTASLNINITNLHSTTASLNTFQSAATIRLNNMESTTSSFDQRLGRLQLETASIDTRIDGIDTVTASLDGRLDVEEGKSTTLATVTSSLDGRLDNVETTTASLDGRLDNVETTTSSINQQIGQIESFTSSFNTAITLNSDDVTVLGNLTVQGTQTQLNTSTLNIEDKNLLIASGAADSSAANGAGITIDGADKTLTWDHSNSNFVFNARVSSSVGFAGDGSGLTGLSADSVAYGNITSKPTLISGSSQVDHDATTNFVAGEHFLQSAITTVGTIGTGVWQGTAIDKAYLDDEVLNTSLNSYTSSNDTAATVQNNRLTNLESTTSSLEGRSTTLATVTSSFDQRLDRLQLETGSLNTSVTTINSRLSNVESTTSSFDGRLDNLQTTTESLDQRLDRIELYTSSNDTGSFGARFTNIESTTSSFDSRLDQLETNTGSLGTAAFFNVTSSIFGDATVVPTAQAVNNAIASSGGGDITAVAAGLGISGGGVTGDVTLNLDTGSVHFLEKFSGAMSGSSQVVAALVNQATNFGTGRVSGNNIGTLAGSTTFTGSFVGDGTNLSGVTSYTDSDNTDHLNSLGVISGSSQISLAGFNTSQLSENTNLYFTNTRVDARLDAKTVISGSSQLSGITNAQLAGSIANGKLANSAITISGTSVSLGGSITDETLFGGVGVVSGSAQVTHDSTTGFVSNEHIDHSNVSITAGTGLNGGGDLTTTRTLNVDNDYLNTSLNSFTSSFNTSMSIDASGVTVLGNLTVQGTQTILDTTTLNVKDKNILVASGAADSAAADGAGLTIGGANETLTWVHADSRFSFSDDLNVGGNLTVTGTVDGRDVSADGTKLDGIEASADVTDTGNVHPIIDAKGIISGSVQVDGASITNKAVSFGGVSVNLGSSDATPAFNLSDSTAYPGDSSLTTLGTVTSGNVTAILPEGVISGSSQQTFTSASFAATSSVSIHTSEWILGADGTNHYTFTGNGFTGSIADPAIYLTRGEQYRFTNKSGGHPFRIQTTANGSSGTQYSNGVTNNDAGNNETLTFNVPMNAPTTLYYQCTSHGNMGGAIYISDPTQYETVGRGIFSGSAQVTGVQGVSLTSDEASQIANIGTSTISATQWGYVGNLDQDLRTTDEPQFNKLGVGGDSDATYELKVTGDIGATGDIVAFVSSDERLKDNIKPIEGALNKVSQISGNTFDWNEEKQDIYKGKDYGVIAQEIKEVMPELVDTRDNGYLAVKYDKIVPLLIESIKELKREIEELKSK